ncbi:40S ribosomal protein S10-A [Coemansia aciculifera]|nr:40S ribosomal protein S10-A [Coemansia aciculifera]
MFIPTANRKLICKAIFKDGVLVAKKDYNAPRHAEIPVRNLEVIKAMQSLTSRGFVKTQFSWQYYYYTLTDEGIEYLREYLNIPQEVFPATFKKLRRMYGGSDWSFCMRTFRISAGLPTMPPAAPESTVASAISPPVRWVPSAWRI